MLLKKLSGVVLFALMLVVAGFSIADEPQEVALPKLPKGAGMIGENAPKSFTVTKSGLKYRVLREGAGDKPTASKQVEVHYHGWLDDGSVFDSSYRRQDTASFRLDGVIRGWTEGLQLIGEGGMIELEIPSKLAYGRDGRAPSIAPNTQLHFLVELIDVK